MIVKGSDIKVGEIYQRVGYTIEVLEIVSYNEKTVTVRVKSVTKSGHTQIDLTNIRKSTSLKRVG